MGLFCWEDKMAALSENDIIDIVYSLYETDTTNWSVTDEEYLAARKWANVAIRRWEFYDNTKWRELFVTLTDAADGTKTLTASTYAYACPTNMRSPASWVRTLEGSNVTFWKVIGSEQSASYANSNDKVCWFTGSLKAGFKVNFNSNVTLTTGHTIEYEYYKTATLFAAITDTTEVPDPYFIVYFILARFLKNDGEDNTEELQESDDRLETMRVANMSGVFGVPDDIDNTINIGFGT